MPTLEHFFNYYVHMKKPSEMPREIDIHFFREDLVPMWEDSPEGGVVILKIQQNDDIDKMWETILLNMIGKLSIFLTNLLSSYIILLTNFWFDLGE